MHAAPAFIASIDGRGKCRIGKIHVYNGPSGSAGAVQITSDRKGNLWYGSIGANTIVKYKRGRRPKSYSIPSASAKPEGVAFDSHGHLWFTEFNLTNLGRLTHGRITEYPITALNGGVSSSVDIVLGPDKRMWFTTDFNGIGAATSNGAATLYSLPNNGEQPTKLAVGPDKNLWFTEFAGPNVGKMTTSGSVTEYNVSGGGNNYGITAGPDGRIWFTDWKNHRIGAMKTDGSAVQYYEVGSGNPVQIAVRSQDRKLYFTDIVCKKYVASSCTLSQGYVGQITTNGVVRTCAIKASPAFIPFGITENPRDHSMWFVDNSVNSRIGKLSVR